MFLIAIDGSTTALPNTKLPKAEFGELKGAPTARIALGFDVLNNRILGADIDKIKTGEREQAKKIIKEILTTLSGNLCCFIFNRGYPCEWLIRLLLDNQVHFVMRVRNKFSLAVDKAPLGSTIVELYPDVKIRVFKFKLKNGTVETLLTDLYDLPSFALKKIYRNRWGVETEYDKLKNKLELGNYTGWTRNCILQNFWINILLAYFSGVISQTATCQIQTKRLGKANQYLYKANMTRVVTSVFEFFTSLVFRYSKKKKMKVLKRILLLSELQPVPIRPDRNIPRNRFKRIAKFHHNRKAA